MLVTLLSPLLLAAAQPSDPPATPPSDAPVEQPAQEAEPAEEPAETSPPEEERKICRLRTVQDMFGKQKTVKSCRSAPR